MLICGAASDAAKTWAVVDLFYDSLPLRQRRRSHFHHFMRDIHQQLQQAAAAAPRATRAGCAGAHCRYTLCVLCLDELFVNDIADAMILGTLFDALVRYGVCCW